MELRIRVHAEDGTYWAEVAELPGCFATGQTLDELVEALTEAVFMYLQDEGAETVGIEGGLDQPPSIRVDELKVEIPEARPKVMG